jgi:hypothetical protein
MVIKFCFVVLVICILLIKMSFLINIRYHLVNKWPFLSLVFVNFVYVIFVNTCNIGSFCVFRIVDEGLF